MLNPQINKVTGEVIGAAIEVHRALGAGLLERAYRECLCKELSLRGVFYQRELPMPIEYKGLTLESGYRVDILVESLVPLELKAVDAIHPLHEAQLLTYLRLGGWRVGLLINFNVLVLKDGIRRKII